jgi:hypothetical protein
MRQPSQYASTLVRRRPISPISSTSGRRSPWPRNQISTGAEAADVNPVTPGGGSVAACIIGGVAAQQIRGLADQTQRRPPRAWTKSAASLLTSTRTPVR